MKIAAIIFAAVIANSAFGAISPNDFARGFRVLVDSSQPLVEVTLPDEVYQVATVPALTDLAVFNAEGTEIPHAICPASTVQPEQMHEQSLPIFASNTSGADGKETNVEVQTNRGTHVEVQEQRSAPNAETRFLIDARDAQARIRAIAFDWSSSDQASEARVSIESSSDLDSWRIVVPRTTLLRAKGPQNSLRRDRVLLPPARYEYLRVRRVDGGPLLQLQSVIAEVITMPAAIEPVWVVAQSQRPASSSELLFDSGRVAPVTFARLRTSLDNYSVAVEMATRADQKSPWIPRWTGESYAVNANNARRESDPAMLGSVTDRYWRVRVSRGQVSNPSLELGYRPSRVQFLAQGAAPYTIGFGSRRAAQVTVVPCGSLLTNMSADDREKLMVEGSAAASVELGGETALQSPPRKTPTRLIALWGSLVVGVVALVAMAVSLIKRLRSDPA